MCHRLPKSPTALWATVPMGSGGKGWATGSLRGNFLGWQPEEHSQELPPLQQCWQSAICNFLKHPPCQSLPGSQVSGMHQVEKEATYTMMMEVVHHVSGLVPPLQP